ncbi:MAG: PaaI family thioesterase [Paracoccaceae bacterium]
MSAANRFATTPEDLTDPDALAAVSGLEFIEGIRTGRYAAPPIAKFAGMTLVEVGEGRVVFEGVPAFDHLNPMGGVHGGWYGIMLDSALSCAVQTRLPAGQAYTTLDYSVRMLRAVPLGAPVRAVGEAVRVGRRTGISEGRILDAEGRVCATGSAACLIFEIGG